MGERTDARLSVGHVLFERERPVRDDRQPEKLIVAGKEYRGHPFVDARVWVNTDRGWVPSRRGVTFKMEELAKVIKALDGALQP